MLFLIAISEDENPLSATGFSCGCFLIFFFLISCAQLGPAVVVVSGSVVQECWESFRF